MSAATLRIEEIAARWRSAIEAGVAADFEGFRGQILHLVEAAKAEGVSKSEIDSVTSGLSLDAEQAKPGDDAPTPAARRTKKPAGTPDHVADNVITSGDAA